MRLFAIGKRKIGDVAKPLSPDTVKRLARIVVVDDEPDSVPSEALRANGYSVEEWKTLDAARLARLERGEFDVVFLDIQGIVPAGFSDTGDGLGVLRRLKRNNPPQVIIACSGQSYTVDAMDFYRTADATLAKPITAIRALETLDGLVRTRLSAQLYWDGVAAMLRSAQVPEKRIAQLEHEAASAAVRGSNVSVDTVEQIVGHIGTVATIAELVGKAIAMASAAR